MATQHRTSAARGATAAQRASRNAADAWEVTVQLELDPIERKDEVERVVRRKVARLRRRFPGVNRCRVRVDVPHRHQRGGRLHRVRIGLAVGGAVLSATRASVPSMHQDVLAAIHDAFAAVERELADREGRRGVH